ncbi:hypothetical protein HMPREF1430_00239 [Helicobacter pylori GAM96Ai]|uniref:hypothetical protein n=1 Tax=Helicobacter pylori TaxID=210 RepID=UPI0002BAAA7E|nr:hypothetical protein [Helicobacter pylori]EMH44824.1 hypothetical protein HMPREF1430_00239 [Helicobacter pylori GAM96Ai]
MAADFSKNAPIKEDIPVPSNNGLIDKSGIDFSKTTPETLDPSDTQKLISPNNRIVQVSYEPENSANYRWRTVAVGSLEEFVNDHVFGENDKSGFYTQSLFKQNSNNSNYGNKKENLVASGGFLILDIDNDIDSRSLGSSQDSSGKMLRADTTHDMSMQKAIEILEKAQLSGAVVPTKSHLKQKHKDFYQKDFLKSFNFNDEKELPPHKVVVKGVRDNEFSDIFGMKLPNLNQYEKETHTDKKTNTLMNYYTFDLDLVPKDRLETIKEQYAHRIAYRFFKTTERFRVIIPVAQNATLSGEFLQNDGIYKEFLNLIAQNNPALKQLFDEADICGTRPSQIFRRSPENLKRLALYSAQSNPLEIHTSASMAILNYQEKTFQKALERYNRLKEFQQKKIEISNEQTAKLKKYPNRLLFNLINLKNKKESSYLNFEKTHENLFNLAVSNEQWVDIFKAITGWQPEREEVYGGDYIFLDERHGPTVIIGSMVGGITPLNPSAIAEFGEHKSMFGFVKERLDNSPNEAYEFIQNQLGEPFIVYSGGGLDRSANYQIINEIVKEAAERNPTNYLQELNERFKSNRFVITNQRTIAFNDFEVPIFKDSKKIATRQHHETVEIPLNDEVWQAIQEAKKKEKALLDYKILNDKIDRDESVVISKLPKDLIGDFPNNKEETIRLAQVFSFVFKNSLILDWNNDTSTLSSNTNIRLKEAFSKVFGLDLETLELNFFKQDTTEKGEISVSVLEEPNFKGKLIGTNQEILIPIEHFFLKIETNRALNLRKSQTPQKSADELVQILDGNTSDNQVDYASVFSGKIATNKEQGLKKNLNSNSASINAPIGSKKNPETSENEPKNDKNDYGGASKSLFSKKPPLDVFKSAIRSGIPISDDEELLNQIHDDGLRSDIRTAAKLLALITESVGNDSNAPYDPNDNLMLKSVLASFVGIRSKSAQESIQKLQQDKQYHMRNPQELAKIDQKINEIMEAFSNSSVNPEAMQLDFIGKKPAITGWALGKDTNNRLTVKIESLKIDPLFAQKIHANAQKNTNDTRKYKEVSAFIQSCRGDYEKMFACSRTPKSQDEEELDYSAVGFIKPKKTKKTEAESAFEQTVFEHGSHFPEEDSNEAVNGIHNAILVEKKRDFNQKALKQKSRTDLHSYNKKDLVSFIFDKNTAFSKMDFEYNKKQTLYINNDQALDTICYFMNASRKQVSMPHLDPVELKKKSRFSLDGKSVKYSSTNKEHIVIKRNDDGAISGIECNNVNGIFHCNERYRNLFELAKRYHYDNDNEIINKIAQQSKAFTPMKEIAPPSDLVHDFVVQELINIISTRGVKDPNDLFSEKNPELKKEFDTLAKAVLGIDNAEIKKGFRFPKDTPLWKRFVETINVFKPDCMKNLEKESYYTLVLHRNGAAKEIPLIRNYHIDKMLKQTKNNHKKNIYQSVDTYLYEHAIERTHCSNSAKMKM